MGTERLVDEQWLDVGKRAYRAYDRRVRERFRLRAVADEDERAEPEEERSDYDAEVERPESEAKMYGVGSRLAAAAAAAEGHVWSSYALRALQLGQPLREALRTASAGVAFDAEEDHEGAAAEEPPALRMTAAPRRATKKKERKMRVKAGEGMARVIDAVKRGASTPAEVAKTLGINLGNAAVTLSKLVRRGTLTRPSKGVYALADGTVGDAEEARPQRVKKPREAAHVARRNGGGRSSDLASTDPAVKALLEQRHALEAQLARIDRALDVLQGE